MTFFQQVYEVVRRIPKGRVITYGDIAKAVGTKDARRVGQALHANGDPQIPCHRVVFADGSLAPGYAFGGERKKRERLEQEGVEFTEEGRVNLETCRLKHLDEIFHPPAAGSG